MSNKIKLFETVMGIAQKGAVNLTAAERTTIEAETKDLLSMASRKKAAKAPEGFEQLLSQLKMVDNADEAFSKVVEYLKLNPAVEEAIDPMVEPEEHNLDGIPSLDKKPMGLGPEKCPMGLDKPMDKLLDKGPKGLDEEPLDLGKLDDAKPEIKEEAKDTFEGSGIGKGEEKGEKPDFGKDKDEKPAFGKDKDEKPAFGKDKDEKPGHKPGMKPSPKPVDEEKKELMARVKKAEENKPSPITASKVRVRITSSRNLLVSYDNKPLFHAIPSEDVKADVNKLKRLANKVYAWCVYEGTDTAAKKCGAKLLAGVDEDVTPSFDAGLTPEEKKPSTGEAEFVTEEKPEEEDGPVTEDAEFVTKETPEKVTAGIEDDAEFVTEETPEAMPSSVKDGQEDVIEESLETPANDIRDDADVNFDAKISSIEANYRKIYSARTQKVAKEAQDAFIDKFIRALRVASKRMLLNYDENPFKAAALDVLTDTSYRFSDGAEFAGMYSSDAQEIVERIASTGHDEFVDKLLDKTASLMKKSEEYLSDLESDLGEVSVKPVRVASNRPVKKEAKTEVRKEASEGNFAINRTPATRSENVGNVTGVREAIGSSLLKRANALKQLVG